MRSVHLRSGHVTLNMRTFAHALHRLVMGKVKRQSCVRVRGGYFNVAERGDSSKTGAPVGGFGRGRVLSV